MIVLVVGASGATGQHVVEQLLTRGVEVRAIVRSLDALPNKPNLSKIKASVHSLSSSEIALHTKGCAAVISCLGHNLTFKGIFGKPRLLVTDTLKCICKAIIANASEATVKIILMNTTGNSNRDLDEKPPLSQGIVIAMLRLLLPPQRDNEKAADYLRTQVGQNNTAIQWVAVRPDALTNENEVSAYKLHTSPIRNVIFDAGETSRINVAHFMSELLINPELWNEWKGKMPVIYNHE